MPGRTRSELVSRLWRGRDPFAAIPNGLYRPDRQGWGSNHPYLSQGIRRIRPAVAIEIGVWKGGSTITMASEMKALGIDGAVLSVDTWLGSSEHWVDERAAASLMLDAGYPRLFYTFCANILDAGLADHVVPLPIDSVNAAQIVKKLKISAQLIHIDGGHDYNSVLSDLREWWPVLTPGGLLIGDDYRHGNDWPEVVAAFDDFFGALGLLPLENADDKCRIMKPV